MYGHKYVEFSLWSIGYDHLTSGQSQIRVEIGSKTKSGIRFQEGFLIRHQILKQATTSSATFQLHSESFLNDPLKSSIGSLIDQLLPVGNILISP